MKRYNYEDVQKANSENKKMIGYRVKTPHGNYVTASKIRILEDADKIEEKLKDSEDPTILVSGEGSMYVSILINSIINEGVAINNLPCLKSWKGFLEAS